MVGIRALGVVSAAGMGTEALCRALEDPLFTPKLGLARPDAPPLPVATCQDFDPKGVLPPLVARRLDRASRLAAVASRQALAAAGELPWPKESLGVALGTWTAGTSPLCEILQAVFTLGPEEAPPMHFPNSVANAPASHVGILEGLGGANLTFFEKQAGGLRAIAEGWRLVRAGKVNAMLAGGVDEAQWLNAETFHRLRALKGDGRPGLTLGEGAALCLLSQKAAVVILGVAAAAQPGATYRYPDTPDSLLRACQKALAQAQLVAEEVELVVSLANGSPILAQLEAEALATLFSRSRPAVVGSVTERLGEGAFASALRAVVASLVLQGQVRPAWPVSEPLRLAGFGPPRQPVGNALVTALAGGGSAVALVLAKA